MAKKIETLIAQEFSFVQELVWLPPCRNPFPRCTEKVLWSYGKLEVLYKHVLPSLKSEKDFQVAHDSNARSMYRNFKALVDRATSIFESDAKRLIKFRRSFCKRVVLIKLANDPQELYDLEREADSLIIQYLERAWGLTAKHVHSIENWTRSITCVEFSQLEAAFQKLFCSFFESVNTDQQQFVPATAENVADTRGEEEANLTKMYSDIFNLPTNMEITHAYHYQKTKKKNRTARNQNPHLEMTMKAMLCPGLHTTLPEENCWHVIFGLVNHDQREIAVQSLSYWSLNDAHNYEQDNSPRSDPEVYTIRWPKGVILKESPAFICYGCQIHCRSFTDSPRVVYSWQYRVVQRHYNLSTVKMNNAFPAVGADTLLTELAMIQDTVINASDADPNDAEETILSSDERNTREEVLKTETCTSTLEDEFSSSDGRSTDDRDYNPLYKRLGSLIWSRFGKPSKKAKINDGGD